MSAELARASCMNKRSGFAQHWHREASVAHELVLTKKMQDTACVVETSLCQVPSVLAQAYTLAGTIQLIREQHRK
eukprot:6186090-Pleurochrysis_carterae.AAC.1